jgi:hypothetical protein
MKKKFFFIALMAAGLVVFSNESKAQYVKIRPTVVVRETPPRPSPQHVWIAPEWQWRNGRYEQVPGRWEAPRRGHSYIAGHWAKKRRGYQWVPGHWN